MIYFTEYELDRLIEDDAPMGDMTTQLLGLAGKPGSLKILARHAMTVCCTEEAARVLQKAGVEVLSYAASGTQLNEGDKILEARGDAASLHLVWRTSGVLIEFASGIATRTRQLVELAKTERGPIPVAGTRKHPPFLKKIALKALLAGGGVPHRTGISDTILIFREHLLFVGGYANLPAVIAQVKQQQKERKVVVEAHSTDEALMASRFGADAVQIDKMEPGLFREAVRQCKAENPEVQVLAAGGVNAANAAAYASAGADVLVTSWMYYAPPADIQVKLEPLNT